LAGHYIPPNENKLTLFINLIIQIQPMLQGRELHEVWIDLGTTCRGCPGQTPGACRVSA
jgi:hypothetical protein